MTCGKRDEKTELWMGTEIILYREPNPVEIVVIQLIHLSQFSH